MDLIYQKIKTNLNILKINNCSILIALSGGIDSMALLHLLLELKNQYNIKLNIAYINHNLRNEDSKKEETFVTRYIQKLKIPLYKHIVPKTYWKKLKNQSIEMAARKIRYNFFKKIITQNNIDYTATAHNFDDKIETFFIQIFRGCGFNSLRSIPIKNKKTIRPLLTITRKEIQNYIISKNIPFIKDNTNELNIYKRNIIRNKLIPVFEEIHPNYKKSFSHVFQFINDEIKFSKNLSIKYLKEILIYKSESFYCLNKIKYSKLPIVIQKNIIILILKKLNYPALPNSILFNALSGFKAKYSYKKKNFLSKTFKNYFWFINQKKIKLFNENILVNKIPFKFKNKNLVISFNLSTNNDPKKYFCFKYIKSQFPLIIRGLNTNDEIFINNKNKKSIKKILNEIGIPAPIHKETIIIETDNKKIIGFINNNFKRISKNFYIENIKNDNILVEFFL